MGEVGHAGVLLVCLGLLYAFASLDEGTGHERGDETERPDCIIVCRNLVVDLVRVAVGVDDGDHRNAKHMCFLDGAMLLVGVDDIDGAGKAFHGTKTAEQLAQASLGLHGPREFLDSHCLNNSIRFFTNDILRSFLGTDENDVATFTRNLRKERVRLVKLGNGLFEIKNVNAVALREDIMLHARVPSADLVTKMHACLEQGLHCYDCHNSTSC